MAFLQRHGLAMPSHLGFIQKRHQAGQFSAHTVPISAIKHIFCGNLVKSFNCASCFIIFWYVNRCSNNSLPWNRQGPPAATTREKALKAKALNGPCSYSKPLAVFGHHRAEVFFSPWQSVAPYWYQQTWKTSTSPFIGKSLNIHILIMFVYQMVPHNRTKQRIVFILHNVWSDMDKMSIQATQQGRRQNPSHRHDLTASRLRI